MLKREPVFNLNLLPTKRNRIIFKGFFLDENIDSIESSVIESAEVESEKQDKKGNNTHFPEEAPPSISKAKKAQNKKMFSVLKQVPAEVMCMLQLLQTDTYLTIVRDPTL